jgi:hypothetical protein
MGTQIPLEEGTRFFIENQSFRKVLIILDKKLLPELVDTGTQAVRKSFNILLV